MRHPSQMSLVNFFLAWKGADDLIPSRPLYTGKALTSDMYCNTFSL